MDLIKKLKSTTILTSLSMAVMLFISSFAVAQQLPQQQQQVREDFSDDELKSFVKAHKKVVEIQEKSQQKMMRAIEKEGLTIEQFNQLIESQQDPDKKVDATPEQLSSFNNAAQQVIKERQETQVQMVSSIEDEGIDINTYQEIMVAYQQSPKVQGKVNELLEQ